MNQLVVLSRLVLYSFVVGTSQRVVMRCVFFLAERPFPPTPFYPVDQTLERLKLT
jgi:hypothetical protein